MTPASLYRLSGIAAMLCGLCIIGQRFIFDLLFPGSLIRVGTFAPQLGLIALVGFYLWQREALGAAGAVGFAINFLGLAYLGCVDFARHYVLAHLDPAEVAALLSSGVRGVFLAIGVIFIIGVVLFGVTMLRAALMPRVATVLFMVGFVPFALSPFFPTIVISVTQVIAAVGVTWMGWALWSSQHRAVVLAAAS